MAVGVALLMGCGSLGYEPIGEVGKRWSQPNGELPNPDGTGDLATEPACTATSARGCLDGDVYGVDSCDQPDSLVEECVGGMACDDAALACCNPPDGGSLARSNWVAELDWTFPAAGSSFSVDYTYVDDAVDPIHYLFPYVINIGQIQLWLGHQTRLINGQPGYMLTRFDAGDPDTEIRLGVGAFTELSGTDIALRMPYPLIAGRQRLEIHRAEAQGAADWFDVDITNLDTGDVYYGGSILIRRVDPGVPGEIQAQALMLAGLFNYYVDPVTVGAPPTLPGTATVAAYSDMGDHRFETNPSIDGKAAIGLSSTYTADDGGLSFANLEVHARGAGAYVGVGASVGRCTGDGILIEP